MSQFFLQAILVTTASLVVPAALRGESPLNEKLQKYIQAREAEFDQIPAERKEQLAKVSNYVKSEVAAGRSVKLTYICTHNSRRSHLGQLWGYAAAAHYGIPGVATYSGGTEGTAFNKRAVAAVQRAGFDVETPSETDNPHYLVRLGADVTPQECFSKKYDSPPNPTKDFCAIMVCTQADEACPLVSGAKMRIAIPYVDPKVSDGRADEAQTYDERCAQIARETLFVFANAK